MPPSSAGPATRSHDPQPTATNGVPADANIDAALARCPTAAEIRVVDRSLWIKFDDHPFTRRLVCRAADGSADLTAFQRHVYQAVLAMRRIPFDEPLPWTGGRSFFRWFTDAVDGITLRTVENSFCCDSGHIVVTTGVFSESPPFDLYHQVWGHEGDDCHSCGLFGLPGLFAHEARHAEGYLHTCGTNDQTFEEMGAWAVHQLYFVWLAEHANSPYMEPSDGPADLYERLADDFSRAYDDNFCSSPL